mmetsp:Transcript_15146/g.36669  ORF Transcript_15146/g.36669 Transcript_15146/m.36669 type:complete len:211 (-) Transcript_15146:446-1078(-)
MPTRPNSLTTAEGDDRAPSGTMSTHNQPCANPPTMDPTMRPRTASEIERPNLMFFLRRSHTEANNPSDSWNPGGASSAPKGCVHPCTRTKAANTPKAMPPCVRVSLSATSKAGPGGNFGNFVIRSRAHGGKFCLTVAPGLNTSAYFTLLSETSPLLRFIRLFMRTTSYAASTVSNFSFASSYLESILFFARTISSEVALSLRPRNFRAPW